MSNVVYVHLLSRILTAGNTLVIRDDRFQLRDISDGGNHDLVLTRVGGDDGGEYSCELEGDTEYPNVITHTVQVLGE